MTRLSVGGSVPPRAVETLNGRVQAPAEAGLTHLQFRRFAGCPVCNLHLRSFVRAQAALTQAGVREVVVFHSSAASLRTYEADLPFDVVPDPQKRLYREFGVEAGARAVLDSRAWKTILVAVWESLKQVWSKKAAMPPIRPEGGGLGLPADFLLDRSGRILACKYGEHADDQWSVEDVIALAARFRAAA